MGSMYLSLSLWKGRLAFDEGHREIGEKSSPQTPPSPKHTLIVVVFARFRRNIVCHARPFLKPFADNISFCKRVLGMILHFQINDFEESLPFVSLSRGVG